MTSNLIIFIPHELCIEESGFVLGKVVHDKRRDIKKFYIVNVCKERTGLLELTESSLDVIGYYSEVTNKKIAEFANLKLPDSIHIVKSSKADYYLKNIVLNNKKVNLAHIRTTIILYHQRALLETELFESKAKSGDHFYELTKLIQSNKDELRIKSSFQHISETIMRSLMLLYLYPVLFLFNMIEKLLPVLKYSSLGLHIYSWLENIKWMLLTVIHERGFKLKTANYGLAIVIDMALGICVLKLVQYHVDDQPSHLLLSNAEKVVETLKDLINWLMGAPAGLKLNHGLNNAMGMFFLYHIQLWQTFLISSKPLLDLAFDVLLLFGALGVTFQISIMADLLALVSFHAYCIYVYAARLFNLQLRGITALFRLFLGKKKNPLREKVDSCHYQTDQLFVGTLSFTILLFLMPTTWVYYTVFTALRLASIGFSGFLTRLKFYLQIVPVYTFWKWLLQSQSACKTVDIRLHSQAPEGVTILSMNMVVAPWRLTWKKCIPDTITCHLPIEWSTILHNVVWGQLLYPL